MPKTLAPPEKPEPTQRTTPSVSSAPAPKEGKWANEIGSEEWREYDPDKGIPRPEGDLTQAEITTILGPGVDAKTGNWILRVLQYRRLSGSLADEGITFPEGRGFARELPLRGLEYLRANYPVDEEAAATRWADEEAAMLEDMLVKDAERLGLYKKEEEPQQGTEFGQRYGQSGLDAIKKHYESQPVKERKSQADEIRENTGTLQTVGNRAELSMSRRLRAAFTKGAPANLYLPRSNRREAPMVEEVRRASRDLKGEDSAAHRHGKPSVTLPITTT